MKKIILTALLFLAAGSTVAQNRWEVSGADSFRIKAWNSWPQAEQVNTSSPYCSVAGPENMQAKIVIKFRRKSTPGREVTTTKIITMDNDRGAAGVASAGILALPFGSAALKERTVTDATATMTTKTISSCTVATPTVCLTSTAHTLTTGDLVYITASNTTPVIDGLWFVTVTDTTHFSIPMQVTVTGTGTLNTSKTLTSATAAFTIFDVGRNITLSTGGIVCADETWGVGLGPWGTTNAACMGPKFPVNTTYQGTIIARASATQVTVKPSMLVNPDGTGVLKIQPVLIADDGSGELGDGWLTGVDINFWNMGGGNCAARRGQAFFEAEINRGAYNMHQGVTLIKQYLEPSGHLSWPIGNVASGKVDGQGYYRIISTTCTVGTCSAGTFADSSGTTLGAGEDWVLTVPAKTHWKFIGARGVFTTSATVATRQVQFGLDDGVTTFYSIWSTGSQAASLTHVYNLAGIGSNFTITPAAGAIQDYVTIPSGTRLTAGWRIRPITTAIQAGDVWSALTVIVEEWIEE